MYIRKYFQQDSKRAALELVNIICKMFKLILNNVEWLDNEAHRSAINKLYQLKHYIGYPDELMDDAKIEQLYEYWDIDENNYLKSVLKMPKAQKYNDWDDDDTRTIKVNAFNLPSENGISKI